MIVRETSETKSQSKQKVNGKATSQPNASLDLMGTILMLLIATGITVELLYLYIS